MEWTDETSWKKIYVYNIFYWREMCLMSGGLAKIKSRSIYYVHFWILTGTLPDWPTMKGRCVVDFNVTPLMLVIVLFLSSSCLFEESLVFIISLLLFNYAVFPFHLIIIYIRKWYRMFSSLGALSYNILQQETTDITVATVSILLL